MSKKLFIILIIFMSLCLLGIIFVQGYWIKNSFDNKEDQFVYNVRQTLIKVSSELQERELEYYYRLYNEVADSIGKTDGSTFREIVYTRADNSTNETFIYSSGILEEDYKLASNFLDVDFDSIDFKKLYNRKFTTTVKEAVDGSQANIETSTIS
ncbi:MAG: two-component sensor histidine kinase, partial [Flavobacteriales bacterium]|nr:two-component sensor histidine kinase [Flavobacteriales bacterium]